MKKKEENVNIKLTLSKELYDTIERISQKLGLEPEDWINKVLLSKIERNVK